MFQLFIPVYKQLCQVYKDLDDERDMVSPLQVGSMFVDWTDPQKAVYVLYFRCIWSAGFDSLILDRLMEGPRLRTSIWI